MTSFAEIKNGKVVRVIVATREVINSNYSGQWIETFRAKNNNPRKRFAGKGMSYDNVKDKFIGKKPFSSWILDSNDNWKAPVERPVTPNMRYEWNESIRNWVAIDNT